MLIYLSILDDHDDKTKFEKLYHNYRYTMLYTANSILNDFSLAEDAVHDAFIRIAKNFHKIGEVDSPATKGFVVIVTRNVALTMVQKLDGYIIADDEIVFNSIADDGQDVFEKAGFEQLVECIVSLPEKYRDIIYLRFVNELPVKNISEVLNIPVETVKKRIQRGRKALIEKLYREGIVNER